MKERKPDNRSAIQILLAIVFGNPNSKDQADKSPKPSKKQKHTPQNQNQWTEPPFQISHPNHVQHRQQDGRRGKNSH